MKDVEQRAAAARFAADWKKRSDEKQETQSFWIALLQSVYGVEEPTKYIQFELPMKLDHTSFIDGYIESTRVLIEQKGKDIDEDLAAFPYVNGGLFADEDVEIPRLDDEVIDLIIHRGSEDFDWSESAPLSLAQCLNPP